MTLGQAARRAIELGGKYDGHEAPADVNKVTKASVAALAGQGLVAAARDNYGRDGMTHSYVAAFAEIEVDVETGKYYIVDFLAYADVGTVIHPRALGGQILGRSTLGIGHPPESSRRSPGVSASHPSPPHGRRASSRASSGCRRKHT
jgi:xanthine dehydrogenase molybdenum-binding subunit